jgi:hypothetical protein
MVIRLTLAKCHVAALDLCTGIAWVGHVVHKNINVSTRLGKLAIDELKNKKPRLCTTLAHALISIRSKNMGARQQAGDTNSATCTFPHPHHRVAAYRTAAGPRR